MLNFFAIVLIIFIGILLLVLKKRSLRKFINQGKLHSVKLTNIVKINFYLIKIVLYNLKEKSTQYL